MGRSKGSAVTFDHPPATREQNNALYPRVVAGDEAAIKEMILANMAMVTKKVSDYLIEFPQCNHLREDLLSQGYVGLVKGVRKMVGQSESEPNPTGFISIKIQYELGKLFDIEATIRVPQRSWARKRSQGVELNVPAKEHSLTVEDVFQRDASRDPRALVDLLDEIYGCCETGIEKDIVRLRIEGRGDDEIAKLLDLPKTTTYMMRRGIYARFLARNPEVRGEV